MIRADCGRAVMQGENRLRGSQRYCPMLDFERIQISTLQSIRGLLSEWSCLLKRDDTVLREVYQNRYAFSSPNVCGE